MKMQKLYKNISCVVYEQNANPPQTLAIIAFRFAISKMQSYIMQSKMQSSRLALQGVCNFKNVNQNPYKHYILLRFAICFISYNNTKILTPIMANYK